MLGIITIHHGVNEGSVWQATCLAQALAPAEIVDYRHPHRESMYRSVRNSPRGVTLDQYRKECLPVSSRQFRGIEPKGLTDFINSSYQALVVGSDEVWRVHFDKRGRQLKRSHPRAPNAYWPSERVEIPLVGVAVSTGGSTLKNAPRKLLRNLACRLDRFGVIGVRDEITFDTLLRIAPSLRSRVVDCPDPTWIDETPQKKVHEKVSNWLTKSAELPRSRMLILEPELVFVRNAVAEIVANSNHHPISLGQQGLPSGVTPQEFVALIQQVDCVVSVRMHALIACLKTGTLCLSLFPRPKIIELRKRFKLPEGSLDTICRDWPQSRIVETRNLMADRVKSFLKQVRRYVDADSVP